MSELLTNLLNNLESRECKVLIVREDGISSTINTDIKQQILDLFKQDVKMLHAEEFSWRDKLEWMNAQQAEKQGFRMCPGAWIRRGVYIGKNVILMPCFVNVGAYIDEGTMIDSGVTIGSCAYVGKRCHISSNVVIAGVLEPVQAMPVIIEDECFIGAGCVLAEGVRVGRNSVLGAGCVITASTRVYNRHTGEFTVNKPIPPNSVVVPGSYEISDVSKKDNEMNGINTKLNFPKLNLNCVVIIKTVDDGVSAKTALNDMLRESV